MEAAAAARAQAEAAEAVALVEASEAAGAVADVAAALAAEVGASTAHFEPSAVRSGCLTSSQEERAAAAAAATAARGAKNNEARFLSGNAQLLCGVTAHSRAKPPKGSGQAASGGAARG
jgi:hypothetical protein